MHAALRVRVSPPQVGRFCHIISARAMSPHPGPFCGAQGKPGGRKIVAVISSIAAAVAPAAASARDPDAQGPFDLMVPSYSASKSAITRREHL